MIRLLVLLLTLSSVWCFSPLPPTAAARRSQSSTCFASQEHDGSVTLEPTTTTTHDFSVTFPSYQELMTLSSGAYITSNVLSVADPVDNAINHEFQVLLYPRGGGHSSKTTTSGITDGGFGMSYKLFPESSEKLGVYLQYLNGDSEQEVDATFSLLLKGQQASGPRFDVEWSSGMRFVPLEDSNLRQGMANDFGAHLMQTHLLRDFLGVTDDDFEGNELKVQVSITIHPPVETNTDIFTVMSGNKVQSAGLLQSIGLPLQDIRETSDDTHHNTEQVRVGKIVVPVLSKLQQRPRMFEIGAYPGVEYRIMRIFDKKGKSIFHSEPGAEYEIKPIYPLVAQLERQWPVRVKEEEIPKLLTSNMYNVISAVGSLLTAVGGLTLAFLVSQAISLFFIPSRSMDPTLQVKDVLVVEKMSPRILGSAQENIGDVVLFHPPERLREIVSKSGGRVTDRDLFVKRIAAGPGDKVSVDSSGNVRINGEVPNERRDMCGAEPLRLIERYIHPGTFSVQEGQVFVLGDCSSLSVDSRVWGPLDTNEIVGKPLMRVWPLESFGAVPSLPTPTAEADWTN